MSDLPDRLLKYVYQKIPGQKWYQNPPIGCRKIGPEVSEEKGIWRCDLCDKEGNLGLHIIGPTHLISVREHCKTHAECGITVSSSGDDSELESLRKMKKKKKTSHCSVETQSPDHDVQAFRRGEVRMEQTTTWFDTDGNVVRNEWCEQWAS